MTDSINIFVSDVPDKLGEYKDDAFSPPSKDHIHNEEAFLSLSIILCSALSAASQNIDVDKVVLIFKTHLDIGYTDFSFNVKKKYLEKFIPKGSLKRRHNHILFHQDQIPIANMTPAAI